MATYVILKLSPNVRRCSFEPFKVVVAFLQREKPDIRPDDNDGEEIEQESPVQYHKTSGDVIPLDNSRDRNSKSNKESNS